MVDHVAEGRCEAAVVPVENSVEGGVTASIVGSEEELFSISVSVLL